MAKKVLIDAQIWFGGYDLATLTNEINPPIDSTQVETTNFASGGWAEILTAVKRGDWVISGFWPAGPPDDLFAGVSGSPKEFFEDAADVPVFYAIENPASPGDVAWHRLVTRTGYSTPKALDDAAKFTLTLAGRAPVVRGIVLDAQVALAATRQSPSQNHGAIASGKRGYACLSVPAIASGSATLKVQSSPDGVGSWTDRFTFAAVSAANASERILLDGPITDAHWRVDVAGTFTGLTYGVFFGIGDAGSETP